MNSNNVVKPLQGSWSSTTLGISNRMSDFRKWLFTLVLVLFSVSGFSQLSGTKTVGVGDDYTSLTAAFAAIQSQTLNGNITLQLTANYDASTETFPIVAPNKTSIGSFNVNIYPTASGLSIGGTSATGIIDLNNTKNITIDGRINATGTTRDLVIFNSDITTGFAVRFINDAVTNTLNYLSIRGGATVTTGTSTSGVVLFSTATSTGNSNNTISNCDIRDAGSGFPQIAINSIGTAAFPNASNNILNNNIANFWHNTLASRGIDLGVGNNAWTIRGNNLFQSSARTSTATATATQTAINSSSTATSNLTISGNNIGGNNIGAGGTYSVLGSGLFRFFAMNIVAAASPASTIQNNLIRNFSIATNVNSSPVFAGIIIQNGSFNIGTDTANTIGQPNGTGSITVTMGGNAATATTALQALGMWSTGSVAASTVNIVNNNIGSFTLDATTVNHALGFAGILASSGSYTALNITNNLIGSTATPNSINSPTLSISGAQTLRGIDVQGTVTGGNINVAVNNNTVANMNQSSTLASVSNTASGANIRGIVVSPAAANGTVTISNNQVYNISGAGATAPIFSSQGSVAGIVMFASSTTSTVQIYDNEVRSIYGTNSGAVQYVVAGIITSNATTCNIFRNKIYDLKNASTSTSTTYPPIVSGCWYAASGGAYTFANNMITLGNGATNNVIYSGITSSGNSGGSLVAYFNSIQIMGTAASGAYPSFGLLRSNSMTPTVAFGAGTGGTTMLFRNNLINNIRNGGTGKHYALGNISNSGATGWSTTASNFNILNAPSASAIAAWGTATALTDYSLAGFRTLTGGEASSLTGVSVTFQDPSTGDLHIDMGLTGNQIESTGTPVVGFTTDFDNQTRPGPTGSVNGGGTIPDIGADEFDGVILDVTAPTIAYTLLNNTSLVGGESLSNFATITDLSGVNNTVGSRPRLYYKRSTDANVFNDNTSATAGWKYDEANNSSSPYGFSIDYTKLSGGTGVSVGTVMQYFVVAEDLASPTPNVAINSGSFAALQTSVNLGASAFPIGGTINTYNIVPSYAGTINVGTTETITSLTNANGLFDKINTGALTASVIVNITSDLTAETGVIGLNQFAEDGVGGYTLTIRPTGAARIISGTPSTPSLLKLNGADRVIINGSLNGAGTDRSLTISNLSTDYDLGNIPDNCVIHVSSPNSTNPATNNTIKNCIIRGLSNVGTEYGIAQGGSDAGGDPGSGALAPNSNNTYENNLIFAANFGVFANGSSSNPDVGTVVKNNVIGSPVNTLKTYYSGFWSQGQSTMQITDNNILGVYGSLSGSFAICGIFINSSSPNLIITGNNITDITNTSTTGGATGIRLGAFGASSSNMLIANNTISDISAPGVAATPTETNNGSGIIIANNVNVASAYKIYNNSINLNTNQVGGNAAAFVVAAGVTTAGALDVRNNSFVTSQTSGTRYAIYVASTAGSAVFSTINRNLYYTTTGGTLGFLTSARTTLAAWQTATGQDANSISADPKYNTAIVLGPLSGSPLLAAGEPVAGVTKDQIGITRSLTTPTIGAYELAGDYAAPIIKYTPLPFTCNTSGSVTLSANITDVSGVNIAPTFRPRIYYNRNNGAFASAMGTQIGGSISNSTWTFSIPLAGAVVGDKFYYFVVAQDIAPNVNVGTSPVGGFGADVNAISAYPPSYDSFNVSSTLAPGTYTVGTGGNYTTLTAAINDYNTKCLSGPVVFSLLNSTYSTATGETMPLRIRSNAYASAANTLTIRPASGVTATITGATTDVIVFNGADFVTIDGSNNGTNTRNLTLASSSGTSGSDVVNIFSEGVGNGARNNTIKNCTIQCVSRGTGANATTVATYYGIISSGTVGGQGPDNDNLTLDNNFFRLASIGVFANSNATGPLDNWTITNNVFGESNTSFTLARTGLSLNYANNPTISGNTFTNINTTDLGSATGIALGTEVKNAIVRRNTFTDIRYTGTGSFGARAIDVNTNATASNIVIDNNSISNVSGGGSINPGADGVSGIRVIGTTDGVKIYFNSINLASGTYAGSATEIASAAVYFGATVTGIDLRNNILYSNRQNSASASARTYAIYSDAPSSAFSTINYNDYAVAGTQGVLGFIGSQRTTLANLVTGFGGNANSVNFVPVFVSATDLHLTATGNCGIDNKGIFITGFTTDIDNTTRSFSPDLGVDEFTSTDNQWTGTVSTNWHTGANWCSGVVPTSSNDVTIPSGTPFAPVLLANASTKNLTINAGATVSLSTFALNVAGTLSGTGTFIGTTSSTLNLSGNGALGTLNLNASARIGNVRMTGTGASLTLGTKMDVYGELSVGGNVLNTGTNLTIKSNINGTGWVAPITTGGAINGTVTVERYINRNAFRAWRLLSVPVSGAQTFRQAWQENQSPLVVGTPGLGTLLTNTAGNNGYDAASPGNSLLSFTPGTPGSFSPVSSTLSPMATNAGYFVYIRGDRAASLSAGVFNPSATTLRTSGTLIQGTQPAITLPAGQNVLVGNVYASAIDFANLTKSGVNAFKVWDPKIAGTSNTGAYQTYSPITGWVPGQGSYGNVSTGRIESGQAFLVNSNSGGSIQFTESAKTTGSINVTRPAVQAQQLKANLYAVTANGNELADGNAIVFNNTFSNAIDADDVVKAPNFGENFGLNTAGKDLVIETRRAVNDNDVIQYSISNLKVQQYAIEFVPQNLDFDVQAYLKDNFEGTMTPISLNANSVYKFKVTTNPASSLKDRFSVVFNPRASVPVTFVTVNAVPKAENVEVSWKMSAERGIQSYDVQHSTDGFNFTSASNVTAKGIANDEASYIVLHSKATEGKNIYRIKSIAKDGTVAFSKVVSTNLIKVKSIAVYPNPISNGVLNLQVNKLPEGVYNASISNKAGQTMHRFFFSNNNEGTGTKTFKLPASLTAGIYDLRVVCPDGSIVTTNVVIAK